MNSPRPACDGVGEIGSAPATHSACFSVAQQGKCTFVFVNLK